jgi:hypothetical protein
LNDIFVFLREKDDDVWTTAGQQFLYNNVARLHSPSKKPELFTFQRAAWRQFRRAGSWDVPGQLDFYEETTTQNRISPQQ